MSQEEQHSSYSLQRVCVGDIALWQPAREPFGIACAFSERLGGVSKAPFDSLNVGSACGDDSTSVQENRRRLVCALYDCAHGNAARAHSDEARAEANQLASQLVVPHQVHGASCFVIDERAAANLAHTRMELSRGYDAIVCTVPNVPVLLGFADCTPIILSCPGAFAVVHAGWRGCMARVCAVALRSLCAHAHVDASVCMAYIGPHIQADDYEVSAELADEFRQAFGADVVEHERNLSMTRVIMHTLTAAGVPQRNIVELGISTAAAPQAFYSYRKSNGVCGRHAAIAYMPSACAKTTQDA
jgi:hypothetical protein